MDSTFSQRRCRTFSAAEPQSANEFDRPQPLKNAAAIKKPPVKTGVINLFGYFDQVLFPFFLPLSYVGMVLCNGIDLEHEIQSQGESNLTFQILLKLALLAIGLSVGAWGWWNRQAVRTVLSSLPGMFLLVLVGWHFFSAPMAIAPMKAAAAAFSCLSVLLLTACMLTEYGVKYFVLATMVGIGLFCFGGAALYVVNPKLATFHEVLSSVVQVDRFAGLSHPNGLGRYAAMMIVLSLAATAENYFSWKWVIPIAATSVAFLLASLSRTPVIAAFFAAVALMLPLLRRKETYLAVASMFFLALAAYLVIESSIGFDAVQDKIIRKGTKSGSAEEVTSLTGRTDIWAYAISRSAEKPMFGYGTGSTAAVMEDRSGHAHNMILQPMLAMGFPCALIVVGILLLNGFYAVRLDNSVLRGVLIFLIVLGAVETSVLGSFPDAMTTLWFGITLLPIVLVTQKTSRDLRTDMDLSGGYNLATTPNS